MVDQWGPADLWGQAGQWALVALWEGRWVRAACQWDPVVQWAAHEAAVL